MAPQFLAVQQPFDEEKKIIDTSMAHSLKYAQVTDLLVRLTLWAKTSAVCSRRSFTEPLKVH